MSVCQRIMIVALMAIAASAIAIPVDAGQRYVDDCSDPHSVWLYGNAAGSGSKEGLSLDAGHAEVTLPGTVVHPGNLKTFEASLEWTFSTIGEPALEIGWAKPFEWSCFDECPLSLHIDRNGQVTLNNNRKPFATWQLPGAENDVHAITFIQEPGRVVLRGGTQETSIPMPAGLECAAGYLTLRLQSAGDRANEQGVKVRHLQIDCLEDRTPLTAAQRHDEIQQWARGRLHNNRATLEQFELHLQDETAAGRWGYSTSLTVSPGLVQIGEKVAVELRVAGLMPSPCEATVVQDYFNTSPGAAEVLNLAWSPDGSGGQTARVEFLPTRTGNCRFVWRIGKEELTRVVGVVDKGYAVCRILLTTYPGMWMPGHAPEVYQAIHRHGLTADYWDGSEWQSPFSRSPNDLTHHYRIFADMRHLYGDRVLPLCNANYLLPGCPDGNMWRLDEDVQRDGIQLLMRLWKQLNLGAMDTFGSYTFGHNTPRVARSLGIKAIDSLVQWQNWRDGSDNNAWLINQWGAPSVPYYVADDDYRKVAPAGSIVALSQGTTSNIRCYNVMTLEGQPQLAAMRAHSDQSGETSNCDRFQTVVDLALAEASCQQEPLFFFVGLENFLNSSDWDQANTLGVDYLRAQARNKKLVFASGADIADYFARRYSKQPENWFYWPDTYCGYQGAYKPKLVPDRIELSNSEFHSVHDAAEALPRFIWDFTRPWSEPVWDDQAAIRKSFGLCDLRLLTAENCVPRMVNLNGAKAIASVEAETGGARIRIEITSPKRLQTLPVAVWQIPLHKDGLTVAGSSSNVRFIPVVDGSTDNLHAVIVCHDVGEGTTVANVELHGTTRQPLEPILHLGPHVVGRIFMRNAVPYAYLWLADNGVTAGTLKIRIPTGKSGRLHYNDGREEESAAGLLTVTLDQSWQHAAPLLSGLTASELAENATFEPAADVAPHQ
jgi:hypothetical protein